MSTPPRMVELECPACGHSHWEIDCDFRASYLAGKPELSYEEREYDCPGCKRATAGYSVLQKAPGEFLHQPHALPMTVNEFVPWLTVFRANFPSHDRLKSVGVFWYPGEAGEEQAQTLDALCYIGTIQGYRLSLSNSSPDDERIRVCVQREGEAVFYCGDVVTLDHCYFGFEADELEGIRQLLTNRASDIHGAWGFFSMVARAAQAKWLPKLLGQEVG